MVQRYKFNCKYRNYLADNFVLGAIIHKICFKTYKKIRSFRKICLSLHRYPEYNLFTLNETNTKKNAFAVKRGRFAFIPGSYSITFCGMFRS